MRSEYFLKENCWRFWLANCARFCLRCSSTALSFSRRCWCNSKRVFGTFRAFNGICFHFQYRFTLLIKSHQGNMARANYIAFCCIQCSASNLILEPDLYHLPGRLCIKYGGCKSTGQTTLHKPQLMQGRESVVMGEE